MDNEQQHQAAWLRPEPSSGALHPGLSAGDGLGDGGAGPGSCMTAPDMFFHSSMDGNANHTGYYATHSRAMHSYRASPSKFHSQ
jgi:hypothetical protein